MTIKNIDTQKMIESIYDYITELESFRPPIPLVITSYFFNTFFKRGKRSYFIQNNPELHKKLQKELDPYFKKVVQITSKDVILVFSGMFLTAFLGAIFAIIVTNALLRAIFGSICAFCFIYFSFWIYTSHKRVAGEKYDEKIKKAVQELIYYEIELIREKGLNPTKYYIKLKHNDYHGLKYKTKDIYYIGYFEK